MLTVYIEDNDEFETSGTYNAKLSRLTGMAAVIAELKLKDSDHLLVVSGDKDSFVVKKEGYTKKKDSSHKKEDLVFDRLKLKHKVIPVFSASNFQEWTPQAEVDIYIAFGVLQEFTDFKYCCGTSSKLLEDLNYKVSVRESKPDAILVSRITKSLYIAEFKMRASQFLSNHSKEKIDVLVVWEDDTKNDKEKRDRLPEIVELKSIAQSVLQESIVSNI